MTSVQKNGSGRFWDVVTKIALAVGAAGGGLLLNHETRLTKIEETRFTRDDGHALEDQTASKDEVAEMRRLLERIDERTRKIEQTTARLETYHEKGN